MRATREFEYDETRDLFGPKGGWCRRCIKAVKWHDCGGTGKLIVWRISFRGRVHISLQEFNYAFCGKRMVL